MAKEKKTKKSQNLTTKLKEPEKRIIQNWPHYEKEAIEANCKKRIAEFTAKDFNELEKQLILMQRAVGANHLLDDLSMQDLIEFLHKEFSDFTTEEIKHAINELIIERLQVFDINGRRLGATTYDQFGQHYMTPILKSYQHFRAAVLKKYYEAIDAEKEAERLKAIPPRTKEDERQERLSHALIAFQNFKNELPCIGLDRVYNFLKAEGKINYTKERRAQFKAQAKDNIISDSKRGDANSRAKSIAEILKTNETYNGVLEIAGKALAVKAYFTELIDMNAELSDFFEKAETEPKNQQVS